MAEPNPTVLINQKPPFSFPTKYIGVSLVILLIVLMIFLLITPLNLYLNLSSLLIPQPLKIDGKEISWDQFRQEILLADLDKNLKTRGQKLDRAIDNSVRLQIMRSAIATPAAFSKPLTLFAEHRSLKDQIEQNFVNQRNGGYFIARFAQPQASESAQLLKDQAAQIIENLQKRLKVGEDFQQLLKEAEQNNTLKSLNQSAFLPGVYLDSVSPDQFPLQIKSVKDHFYSLKAGEVSDVLTLSWDDYYGLGDTKNFTGEFAYAVLRVDRTGFGNFSSFEAWLQSQKQEAQVESRILVPFTFKWF